MLSIIIPARQEKYLEKTIRDVLSNAEGEIEVIAELDGWLPNPRIVIGDNRVIFYHHKESIGQRACVNHGARTAKGKFIMKLDAHCALDKGFDVKLAKDCEYDWTVIPRMYNLDINTWKPKLIENFNRAVRMGKLHDYLYMAVNGKNELRTMYYTNGNVKLHQERKHILIDDTMSCMGPCFFMHKDRFWELGGCDEGHEGGWGQQAVEVACKAWLSGGSLKVNKKTWFAHWFRAGDGGFPYPISGNQINRVRKYSTDLWLNDKWDKATRKFQWLVDKFTPQEKMDTEKIVRSSFNWRMRNLPWFPRRGKREELPQLFNKLGFKNGVEVGTRQGDYAELLCKAGLKLTSVDPYMGRHEQYYESAKQRLSKYGAEIIRKTSMDAVGSFADESIDFVYIDGNHRFEYVMQDLIKWCPKVRRGGIVAGHDYAVDTMDVVYSVDAYTRSHDIKPWYVTRELVPSFFWVKK